MMSKVKELISGGSHGGGLYMHPIPVPRKSAVIIFDVWSIEDIIFDELLSIEE